MSVRPPKNARTYLWDWLTGRGIERCRIWPTARGWHIASSIITVSGRHPAEARYQIACDKHWRTQRASITLDLYDSVRGIEIAVEDGAWRVDGRVVEAVHGCVDIDLGWSPSTNTLPIRRLDLAVGKSSGPLRAAWLRFPELTLEPLPQEYTRVSKRQYRYTSRGGEFTALLDVDEDGVVQEYERYWRRVG